MHAVIWYDIRFIFTRLTDMYLYFFTINENTEIAIYCNGPDQYGRESSLPTVQNDFQKKNHSAEYRIFLKKRQT